MTQLADGSVVCNDCGQDAGNGGVHDCLVISDLNFATGNVVNLHFCRRGVNGTSCAARRLDGVTAADYPHSQADAASYAAAQVAAVQNEQQPDSEHDAGGNAQVFAAGTVLSPEESAAIEAEQADAKPKQKTRARPRKKTS